MNKSLSLNIETLTPLWTAGVDGKVDRVHETGLMGSFRWWYEAMVRGVGGKVCNPVEQSCQYDEKKPHNGYGLCPACQIFGATGWKRRFRLDLIDKTVPVEKFPKKIKAKSYEKDGKTKTPTWYFKDQPCNGQFTLRLQSLDSSFNVEIIGGLIQFLANHAAIGARNQMGFGVIKITKPERPINMQTLYDNIIQHKVNNGESQNLPAIDQMFFAKVKASNSEKEETFNLKYDLRNLFRNDKKLRHFLMGTVADNKRIAAKIKMSHPYGDNTMRVWGWIPSRLESDKNACRNVVIQNIVNFLQPKLISTDSLILNKTNKPKEEYLRSLLEIKG